MPENEFSLQRNGCDKDAVQNHKHLKGLTKDELTDVLSDMWDAMDEINYDPAQMDVYLAELEKQEPISPDFDVNMSLAIFHEKHARLFEQNPPVQISTAAKPVHRRRWHTSLVAAIVAVVVILCSMVTAQAFGLDVFGAIARWTKDTFNFSIINQPSNSQENIPSPATNGDFATLQDALDACGLLETVSPQWYPAGLKTTEISVFPRSTGITIQAEYEIEEVSVSITIRQYPTAEDAKISVGAFEKDSDNVMQYESNGIIHYFMSNNSKCVVTWVNNALVCSIIGDLTVDELKQMIDSIYEG